MNTDIRKTVVLISDALQLLSAKARQISADRIEVISAREIAPPEILKIIEKSKTENRSIHPALKRRRR